MASSVKVVILKNIVKKHSVAVWFSLQLYVKGSVAVCQQPAFAIVSKADAFLSTFRSCQNKIFLGFKGSSHCPRLLGT